MTEIIITIKNRAARAKNSQVGAAPPAQASKPLFSLRGEKHPLKRRLKKRNALFSFYDLGQILIEGVYHDIYDLFGADHRAARTEYFLALETELENFRLIDKAQAEIFDAAIATDSQVFNFEAWTDDGENIDVDVSGSGTLDLYSGQNFLEGVRLKGMGKNHITSVPDPEAEAVNLDLSGEMEFYWMPKAVQAFAVVGWHQDAVNHHTLSFAPYQGYLPREPLLNSEHELYSPESFAQIREYTGQSYAPYNSGIPDILDEWRRLFYVNRVLGYYNPEEIIIYTTNLAEIINAPSRSFWNPGSLGANPDPPFPAPPSLPGTYGTSLISEYAQTSFSYLAQADPLEGVLQMIIKKGAQTFYVWS